MDILTAAFRRLISYEPLQVLIASGNIGTDAPVGSSPTDVLSGAWVFQGLTSEGTPYRDPEGSGKSAVTITRVDDWTGANAHNSAGFPQLQLLVYTDSSRDETGGVIRRDADTRCYALLKALDPCFHLPGATRADRLWSGIRVHSSIRSSNLSTTDVPGTNEATFRGTSRYNLETD